MYRCFVWSRLLHHCWNTISLIILLMDSFKLSQQRNKTQLNVFGQTNYQIRLCTLFQIPVWLEDTVWLLILRCYSDHWCIHLWSTFHLHTFFHTWDVFICNGFYVRHRRKFDSNKWNPIKTEQNWKAVHWDFSISNRSKRVSKFHS